ncbi:MAG TPA: hypothetical protein VIG24_18050, partial [Acidimicrobiia bacterium]
MSTLFRTRGFTKYYGSVQSNAIREAARLTAAVEHPDVPKVKVGAYRSLVAELLTTRADYQRYSAMAEGTTYHTGALPLSAAQAEAMARFTEVSARAVEYFTEDLGWSIERARAIVADLVAEHEDRAREYLG